jgi:DNA processing protein
MDELSAWMTLMHAPDIHAGVLQELLAQHGSVAAVANASIVPRLRPPDRSQIERDLRWLEEASHYFVPFGSDAYPPLLATLPDAPIGLFVRGNLALLGLPQLAVVGSRNPTAGGRDNATNFAAHLARCGLTITSGLAIGIDAAAHRGALDAGGTTIAVCGTGIDVNYPPTNAQLAADIASNGALISEFPLGTRALKSNFPRRNRLISGLSLGTLVVEAALRSGSLITARLAAEQGREVFALPGSIHNPMARGCHRLLREGAKLVETAADIFAELRAVAGVFATESTPSATRSGNASGNFAPPSDKTPVLDKASEILLDALGFEPASVDTLIARTGLTADEVASMLLILELEARIDACPGGLYVRRVAKAAK